MTDLVDYLLQPDRLQTGDNGIGYEEYKGKDDEPKVGAHKAYDVPQAGLLLANWLGGIRHEEY
jgi:hypothetical protein